MRNIAILLCLFFATFAHAKSKLQDEFDYLGPTMKTMQASSGRTVVYLDEGEKDWHVVVFVGGSGTSGRVFAMLEFLRETRQNLKLRFIGVERNGFGTTAYDESLGYADYAEDVEALLAQLGVDEFSLFPVAWFGFAPESPIHRVPGFQDAAYDDSARTFNMGGQAGDPAALHHEFQLYCQNQSLPDLAAVTAPVYLYYGDADPLTPIIPHARRWQAAYVNAEVKARIYPGEGHDAQYRHLDQILVDLAGMNKVVVCDKGGKTKLVKEPKAEKLLAQGGSLGICAWRE